MFVESEKALGIDAPSPSGRGFSRRGIHSAEPGCSPPVPTFLSQLLGDLPLFNSANLDMLAAGVIAEHLCFSFGKEHDLLGARISLASPSVLPVFLLHRLVASLPLADLHEQSRTCGQQISSDQVIKIHTPAPPLLLCSLILIWTSTALSFALRHLPPPVVCASCSFIVSLLLSPCSSFPSVTLFPRNSSPRPLLKCPTQVSSETSVCYSTSWILYPRCLPRCCRCGQEGKTGARGGEEGRRDETGGEERLNALQGILRYARSQSRYFQKVKILLAVRDGREGRRRGRIQGKIERILQAKD
eukprot:768069-Hanusia_phi.AAC.3